MQSCCFGDLVYPSILSHGPKELGLWLKVSGPKSVFHVAAMIAPWLEGFAWSKPTPGVRHLQDMQSSVSACFQLKFYRSFCWARRCFNRAEFLIRWSTSCLTTKKKWRIAMQCRFAMHSARIFQCNSGATEPCILATPMLQYISAVLCPCHDGALQKNVQRNRSQPPHSCKTYSCQRAQGSGFFKTKAVARELIWSIPVTHNFPVQRIRAKWLDWTTRSCYFGALVYLSIAPKAPKGLGCEWVPLVQRVSSM